MLVASSNFGESWILEIVALVLVLVVIGRKVWPPLRRLMNAQLEKIRGELAAGEEARAAAERLVAERTAALEAARSEAVHVVEEARQTAANSADEGRTRAEAEYERIVARIETEIALEVSQIRAEVMAEAGRHIVDAVRRVVDAELDQRKHRRLLDEAIAAAESKASA